MKKLFRDLSEYKLSQTDIYIIDRIEKHVNDFLELSISDFSKVAHCSTSALSRLTKKLGFKNYSLFKLFLMSNNNKFEKEKKLNIYNTNEKIKYLANAYTDTIKDNVKNINDSSLKKMSQNIIDSDNIVCFGSGSSSFPLRHLEFNLQKIGKTCFSYSDIHKVIHILSNSSQNTILILASKELKTKEIKFLLKFATSLRIKTFIFTANKDVAKIKRNNTIIYSHFPQENWKFSISSKIALLFYVDLLMLYIYEKYEKTTKIKNVKDKFIKKWNEYN